MQKAAEEMSLLTLRIMSELDMFVADRKSNVSKGVVQSELAALQVQQYGYGLAKALSIAEDLFDIPHSNMQALVNRLVLEVNPSPK
jgi:hypothetical protein